MISSYRLGDLVLIDLNRSEKKELLLENPNSIGSKYILEKIQNYSRNNIDIITEIVLEYIEQNIKLFPIDISESTLIHLRLGDVIAGNQWHEIPKRPLDINYIKSLVAEDTNKKYVIGKCFFAKTSSTNYEECIKFSNEYLQNVINELDAEHLNNDNADLDLCCAVKSKLFVPGRGNFSKLIVEIRKKLNLDSIEIT